MNDDNKRTSRWRARALVLLNDSRWGRGDGGRRSDESRQPQGGRNGDGPPDLDEMWRDFNRRLTSLFKRKGGGGFSPRPDNGRGARIGLGIVIGVLIAIYVGSGVFVVPDGQTGVVVRLGQYRYSVGQGVHWRLPWPFETQQTVNVGAIRTVEVGRNTIVGASNLRDASVLTRDGDIVDVHLAVQYQVRQPTDYLFKSVDPDMTVTQAAQAAVREFAGAHSTSELLDGEREPLRTQLVGAIQHALDAYNTGLAVTGVTIQSVDVPDAVQPAFADAAKAQQDSARAKRDAQAYADQLLPRTQADAAKTLDDAKAYRDSVVARAEGDAQRFAKVYEQYAKAPAVVRERLYLDTMQQIYSKTNKVFVDSKSGNNVIYLPLDKIAGAAQANAAASAGPASAPADASAAAGDAGAAPATPPAGGDTGSTNNAGANAGNNANGANGNNPQPQSGSDPLRSREAFRSRDRESDVQ